PFMGGESKAAGLSALPQHLIGTEPLTVRLKLRHEAGKAIDNQKLRTRHKDGTQEEVETDSEGDTLVVMSGDHAELLQVQLADNEVWEIDDQDAPHDDDDGCCPVLAAREGGEQ